MFVNRFEKNIYFHKFLHCLNGCVAKSDRLDWHSQVWRHWDSADRNLFSLRPSNAAYTLKTTTSKGIAIAFTFIQPMFSESITKPNRGTFHNLLLLAPSCHTAVGIYCPTVVSRSPEFLRTRLLQDVDSYSYSRIYYTRHMAILIAWVAFLSALKSWVSRLPTFLWFDEIKIFCLLPWIRSHHSNRDIFNPKSSFYAFAGIFGIH